MPALGAGPRVVGNFVGGQTGGGADVLCDIVEITPGIVVGNDELAGLAQREERRVRLDRQLIERQMFGGLIDRELQFVCPFGRRLPRPRVDQVE
jgi:hypothetical protein